MKIRPDFVTNSSTSHHIVRNVTNSLKTMLDLVKEAASNERWFNANWWHEDQDVEISGNEYLAGQTFEGKSIPPKECQKYLELVERLELFPPHTDIYVDVSWGFDPTYGDIYIVNGVFASNTKSFIVRHLPL